MRLTRVLAAAAFAIAAATAAPATASEIGPDCEEYPEECYDCVMAPCYPEDWPPFLIDKVNELLGDEGSVTINPLVVCVEGPCTQPSPVEICVTRLGACT